MSPSKASYGKPPSLDSAKAGLLDAPAYSSPSRGALTAQAEDITAL